MEDHLPAAENQDANAEESDKDRWEAFVTQTDWSGPVMQESWYGHRNPCRRIALFVHLSSFLSAAALAFHAFPNWPILHPYLSPQSLKRIKESHADCLTAICHTVEDIQLECEMTTDMLVVMDSSTIPEDPLIALPAECHEAIRLSLGDGFEHKLLARTNDDDRDAASKATEKDDELPPREIDLIHFQDSTKGNDKEKPHNIPIFKVLPEHCIVEEGLLEALFLGEIFRGPTSGAALIDLVDSFSMKPGDREIIELRSYACPQYMSRSMREEILPKSTQVYELLLSWRRSGAIAIMYWFSMMYHSAMCATRIFFLTLPAFFLRLIIMPKNEIRGKRITLFHTLSTLLLLTTLADEGSGGLDEMMRTGVVVLSALSFGNHKAALEWSFLFFLSYMDLDSLSEVWDQTVVHYLYRLDSSKRLIPWIETSVSFLVPGFGLWKVVTVYVIYMAFPRIQRPSPPPRQDIKRD